MMLHRETIDGLLEAIAVLQPEEREVIRLRHIEQRPMDEVAQLLGISRHSASRRWKSALKTLGVKLRESES
ncbi:MAG: sigma-70 family RNA polymerase sigma factor [Pirellulaceae bacterium]